MHGSRKKQLLDSLKSSQPVPGPSESSAAPPERGCGNSERGNNNMTSSLNLNQPLTDQLTSQQRRLVAAPDTNNTASDPDRTQQGGPAVGAGSRTPSGPGSGSNRRTTAADTIGGMQYPGDDRNRVAMSHLALQQQALTAQQAAAAAASLRFQLPTPAALLSPYLLQPDSAASRQLELLYQMKYPRHPVPPPWMLHQFQDELIRDAALLQAAAAAAAAADHRDREIVEQRRQQQLQQHQLNNRHDRASRDQHIAQSAPPSSAAPPGNSLDRDGRNERLPRGWEQQQQQQQSVVAGAAGVEQRFRERALIVDEAAAGCVADAVDHHFNESLARLKTTCTPYSGLSTSAAVSQPWNPALSGHSTPSATAAAISGNGMSGLYGAMSNSAFLPPPGSSVKKSPVEQRRPGPPDLISSSQVGANYSNKMSAAEKLKYDEKSAGYDVRGIRVDDRGGSRNEERCRGGEDRSRDTRLKLDDKEMERMRYEELSKLEADRLRYEELAKQEVDRLRYAERCKYEDRARYHGRLKYEEQIKLEDRVKFADRPKCDDRYQDERAKMEERARYERHNKYDDRDHEEPMCGEMRPQPAHNGTVSNGPALYSTVVSNGIQYTCPKPPSAPRESPGNRQTPSAKVHPASRTSQQQQQQQQLQQQQQQQQSELNFSLYGYQPYSPIYISHEKLNNALTGSNVSNNVGSSGASAAKDLSAVRHREMLNDDLRLHRGQDLRAGEALRAGDIFRGGAELRAGGDVTLDDGSAAKQTSVIVEHRSRLVTVDPYRSRGSITHGTADPSAKLPPPAGAASGQYQRSVPTSAASVALPRPAEDMALTKGGKPTCVVNGLCWSGTATSRPVSPNKSELIKQGLVPNPLYSSASRSSLIDSKNGLDFTISESSGEKRPRHDTAGSSYIKKPRCEEPSESEAAAGSLGAGGVQVSYIDSFKSFVDHAVQNAFLNDTESDAALRHLTASLSSAGSDTVVGPGTDSRSLLRSLSMSPAPFPTSVPSSVASSARTSPLVQTGRKADVPTTVAVAIPLVANQMPSLVSSVSNAQCLPAASCSPVTVNQGPPLLVPQRPLEDGSMAADLAPALPADRQVSGRSGDSQVCNSGQPAAAVTAAAAPAGTVSSVVADTDSDTLSAHSPAPLLLPVSSTPPPCGGASSRHLKKSWLMRYSDEYTDRKPSVSNPATPSSGVSKLEMDNGGVVKEDCRSGEDGPKSRGKPGGDELESDKVLIKQEDCSDEKVPPGCDTVDVKVKEEGSDGKKPLATAAGNASNHEDKETVKNCYINCSYVSDDKDSLDHKSPKDNEASHDSDSDSRAESVQSRKRKSGRTKKTAETVAVKKRKTCGSSSSSSTSERSMSSRHSGAPASNNDNESTCSKKSQSSRQGTPSGSKGISPTLSRPSSTGPNKAPGSAGGSKVAGSTVKSTGSAGVMKVIKSAPPSDCESKLAARLKELKGKPRFNTVSLSAVLESKPLNRCTSEARRKKTREPFVQDGPCCDVTPKLMKCRECKVSSNGSQRGSTSSSQLANNIFCRFYAFRKLCYSAKGLIAVSGFCKPTDADADDVELWLPMTTTSDHYLDVDSAKYVICLLSDCFIKVLEEEKRALELGKSHGSKVVWKRAIQGVREMCDACDATLFNVHWTCAKCGFAVCSDCYRLRCTGGDSDNRSGAGLPPTDRWLTCSANRQPHELDALMTTQIIPSDVLPVLGRLLRDVMSKWQLSPTTVQRCENGGAAVNGLRTTHGKLNKTKRKKLPRDTDSPSAQNETEHCSGGSNSSGSNCSSAGGSDKCNGTELNGADVSGDESEEHVMTSLQLIDGGRLLQMTDSKLNTEDLKLFHSHWQKALPVVVSRPDTWYRSELWRPSALARCGGYPAVDTVSGADVPASRFWEQFERSTKSVLPRQKDWPSPDDLAAFSAHLHDLDTGLPLPEYTRVSGTLHPVSHLPEYFVRPELTSLRLHAGRCTGLHQVAPLYKLRVDAMDTASAAVYVADTDSDEQRNAVSASLEAAGCSNSNRHRSKPIAAVWHVYRPQDADKIRDFINKDEMCSPDRVDCLASCNAFLDSTQRSQLQSQHHIQCTTIIQSLGDVVLIPALAPYQVSTIQNCVLASREFMSPESLRYCQSVCASRRSRYHATAAPPTVFEDQLQGKNLIYHAVKDAISVLQSVDP